MKDINKIKIRIKLYKCRYLIYTILFGLGVLVLRKVWLHISFPIDSTTIGMVGTLLGAIVGGIFTLIGSIYVNNKQLVSNSETKRKNTIYKPLYDELIEINKIITEDNPYPKWIAFCKSTQTIIKHPQFDVWNKINSDSRILETPKCLKEQYNKLINCVKKYEKIRNTVGNPIQIALSEILDIKYNKNYPIHWDIGDLISIDVLENKFSKHPLKEYINIDKKEKISDEDLLEIQQDLLIKCNEIDEVKNVRNIYNDWLNEQEKTIELLESLIIEVGVKYEKQRN